MSRQRIATFVLAFVLLDTVVAVAWVVYDFSASGIGELVGNVLGAALIVTLVWLVLFRQRPNLFTPLALSLAIAIVVAGHWREFADGLDVMQAKPYLDGGKSAAQIAAAAKEHPDNKLLHLFAFAYQVRADNQRKMTALIAAVEPPGLHQLTLNEATDATKLDAFVDMTRQAEDNAREIPAKYDEIIADDRRKLGDETKGFAAPGTVRDALAGFDKGDVLAQEVAKRVGNDLVAIYAAMRAQAVFLQQRFGTFKVENGRLSFKDQQTADVFNATTAPIEAAGRRYHDDMAAINRYSAEQESRFVKPM